MKLSRAAILYFPGTQSFLNRRPAEHCSSGLGCRKHAITHVCSTLGVSAASKDAGASLLAPDPKERPPEKFSQNRKQQLYPESLTATMQKQILNTEATCQIDNRLPLMYKLREKKPVTTFPFSVHDNRHCLMNVGEYLDSGLGLKKFQQEMCQHCSPDILLLAHEPFPSSTSIRSIYQTSFVQYPNTEKPLLGRFPKNHVKRSIALKPADKNECMWFSKCYASPHNVVPVEPDGSSLSEPKQLLPAVQATE